MSRMIGFFMNKYQIIHQKSSPYHPQANGQVEVTNKELQIFLTKSVLNKQDWLDRLDEAIWAYNTTWKTTTGFSPYALVYGHQ